MNPDLAKALGEIERGAERRLQAKRVEFERLQQELGEGQKIVGHVGKIEEPGAEEVAAQVPEIEVVQVEKGATARAETVETEGRQRWKTQSVAAIKKAAVAAKIKQQEKLWKEVTKWRRATEEGLGDVDLQEAMEDMETGKTVPKTTTAMVTTSTSLSMVQTTAEVYAKPYTKSAELRGERSSARWEKKETWEKQLKERQEKENTEKAVRLQEIEEQHEVVERALLEEGAKKQQEIVKKLQEKEARRKRKERQRVKDKDAEKELKDKDKEKEARKHKYIEEEEAAFVDDEEQDPDFNPEEEFIEPDDDTIEDEEEDTFQVEKHSHALNFAEAGEFVVWVHSELQELQQRVRKGKDMEEHYKTFVINLKDGIVQVGSYTPIEAADVEGVMKTIIGLSCMAGKRRCKVSRPGTVNR